jgi:hypothetical protein
MVSTFLYFSAKMLRTKKDPSKAAAAKTSLVQAPKSKESLEPLQSRAAARLTEQVTFNHSSYDANMAALPKTLPKGLKIPEI